MDSLASGYSRLVWPSAIGRGDGPIHALHGAHSALHRCPNRGVVCHRSAAGKSRVLALLTVCLATFRDYSAYLAPGERPLVMVLAKDRDQAGVVFGYARALIAETPMLAKMLIRETSDTLELSNGVFIGVHTSSYKSVRGRTVVACLNDEIAFWESDDSRNPAAKILAALRPSISTIPGAMLLCASSTYTQDGPLYKVFQKHHGRDASSVMVWKADTQTMNPSFRQDVIDAAYIEDPQSAAAEYGSEWLSDARAHFPDADIDAAIASDRQGLVQIHLVEYIGICDPSGGVNDDITIAIAHSTRTGQSCSIVLRSRSFPLSPRMSASDLPTCFPATA